LILQGFLGVGVKLKNPLFFVRCAYSVRVIISLLEENFS